MPYSYNEFTSDGTTVVYPISFEGVIDYPPGYLSEDHVFVYYDGIKQDQANRSFDTPTQVRLISAPANGVKIKIARESSVEKLVVDFEGGAQLSESNLDKSTLQTLYLTQEAYDAGTVTTGDLTQAEANAIAAQQAAEAARDAAQASAAAAATSETNIGNAEANSAASAAAAATSESNAAASAAAAAASESNASTIEADVIAQGNTQVARVTTEGDTQVARLEGLVTDGSITRVPRQAILTTPELTPTPSTVETAATKTGDLRNTYHDLGLDMLTGGRGGLILEKLTTGSDLFHIQSSILSSYQSFFQFSTAAVGTNGVRLQQMLATGVQLGSGSGLADTNLLAFNTTHEKWMADGSYWQYNPVSGFAMCIVPSSISGDHELLHPMGKKPIFFSLKYTTATSGWFTKLRDDGTNVLQIESSAAQAESTTQFTGPGTNTYIPLGSAIGSIEKFGFGWFGDDLSDLEAGAAGIRNNTMSWVHTGSRTVDVGFTPEVIIAKKLNSTGNWFCKNAASGWGLTTYLNTADAEVSETTISVSGQEVTFDAGTDEYVFLVIGSTATREDVVIKQGTQVVRKVGTAAADHRVDLGHDFSSGNNGGMVMCKNVTGGSNLVGDTVRGASNYLITNGTSVNGVDVNTISAYTTTGVTLGSNTTSNSTGINQYSVFGTTYKITTGDGLNWQYNPTTGFAMCQYTGDDTAGRTLQHPMGKKLIMGWFKNLDAVQNWVVYSHFLGATKHLRINTTDAEITSTFVFNDVEPTDTLITLGDDDAVNGLNQEHIFYGWFGEDISDAQDGSLWGVEGVTAFWEYVGGSGVPVTDTKLNDVQSVLNKYTSTTSGWSWINSEKGSYYQLNTTTAEGSDVFGTEVNGSIITFDSNTATIIRAAFSSGVASGIDDQVILPASASEPFIGALADGFSTTGGYKDKIAAIETSTALTVTGDAGEKFIKVDENGVMSFSGVRPVYTRDDVLTQVGWVYDIDAAKMYNRELGPDIVTNGTFDTDTDWIKGAGWTIANGLLTATNATGNCDQVVGDIPGGSIQIKFSVKNYVSGNVRMRLTGSSNVSTDIVGANGDYTFIVENVPGNSVVRVLPLNSAVLDIDNVSVKAISPDSPEQTESPALFLGECKLDTDGNVYDIVTYQPDVIWESEWFTGYADTVFSFENKFGHTNLGLELVGRTGTEIVTVTDEVSATPEDIKATLGSTLDATEYKIIARRSF